MYLGFDFFARGFDLQTYIENQKTKVPTLSSKIEIRKLLGMVNVCKNSCPRLGEVVKSL